MHKRLTTMIENLTSCIEYEMEHLEEVDTCELGEAVDILKDLHEALYYHTVTEAMKGEGAYGDWPSEYKKTGHHQCDDSQVMYYGGDHKRHTPMTHDTWSHSEDMMEHYPEDGREGRSHKSRRMYMEAKHSKDKAVQLRELEKYMQELTSDMVEMIEDASPEEKQYLEKKISALAAKIGQMK